MGHCGMKGEVYFECALYYLTVARLNYLYITKHTSTHWSLFDIEALVTANNINNYL